MFQVSMSSAMMLPVADRRAPLQHEAPTADNAERPPASGRTLRLPWASCAATTAPTRLGPRERGARGLSPSGSPKRRVRNVAALDPPPSEERFGSPTTSTTDNSPGPKPLSGGRPGAENEGARPGGMAGRRKPPHKGGARRCVGPQAKVRPPLLNKTSRNRPRRDQGLHGSPAPRAWFRGRCARAAGRPSVPALRK